MLLHTYDNFNDKILEIGDEGKEGGGFNYLHRLSPPLVFLAEMKRNLQNQRIKDATCGGGGIISVLVHASAGP